MMFRFSATIACQYDSPFSPFPAARWEEALDWAAACGLDAAEPCIADYRDFDLPLLQRALQKRGLGCSTLSTGQALGREGISLLEDDPQRRRAAVERVCEHIAAAEQLGSCVTVGLLRGRGDAARPDEMHERLCESLRPCLQLARERGVTLLIESINRYETALLPDAASVLRLIDDLGAPQELQVLWDLFHANIEDADFAASIAAMGKRLGHVHLADSNRVFPGHGHIDFDRVARLLRESGYDRYLSLECFDAPSPGTIVRETPDLLRRLRGE